MKRYFIFHYAVAGYVASLVSLTFLIFWLYPWSFMPVTVDSGSSGSWAWLVDILLIVQFGLQHSLMARTIFKERAMGSFSVAFRAATYALFSSLSLMLIFLFWQPLPQRVWDFSDGALFYLLTLLYLSGWIFAFVATFMIDHFELFGLHQGYRVLKKCPEPVATFQQKGFYNYVRHPIQAGTIVGLWATPVMTWGHLLFAGGMTLYILVGLYFEERDLVRTLGEVYRDYQKRVPMLWPF